jgi:uncharacterized protein (TIGR00730 family)
MHLPGYLRNHRNLREIFSLSSPKIILLINLKTVGVFCGSSMGRKPEYKKAARQLGLYILEHDLELVYGGANVGLMKILAETILEKGGRVTGVMPRMLVEKEVAHVGLTQMHIVESMSERKTLIIGLADAFIALPGGFGTLDELLEVITVNQLRLSDKPIGILNVLGYFDPLLQFFEHGVKEGFLREEHSTNLIIETSMERLFEKMNKYKPLSMDKWIKDIHEESKSSPGN